jgi:hypothetical protein
MIAIRTGCAIGRVVVVLGAPVRGDNGLVTEQGSMINREIRCRCGQLGVISGVEGPEEHPDFVWVEHLVRLAMQTHIHRKQQMPAVLAQLAQ